MISLMIVSLATVLTSTPAETEPRANARVASPPAADEEPAPTQVPSVEPPAADEEPACQSPWCITPPAGETTSLPAKPSACSADDEPAPPLPADEGDSELERRIRRKRRNVIGIDALRQQRAAPSYPLTDSASIDTSPWIGQKRPDLFRQRSSAGAFALGALVGFGSGYYYAGEPRWGLVFSIVDTTLLVGFVATTVALNDLVVEHDFRSGHSLARGERDFGGIEGRLYAASIAIALVEIGSHLFQGFGSSKAARRTNELLSGFSFIPLDRGTGVQLELGW